jgi:hypothetical protein
MKWIGLDTFLTNNKTVTKAEIENFVKNNSIDVSEVKFTSGSATQSLKYSDEINNMINTYEQKFLNKSGSYHSAEAMDEAAANINYDVYKFKVDDKVSDIAPGVRTVTNDFQAIDNSTVGGLIKRTQNFDEFKVGNKLVFYELKKTGGIHGADFAEKSMAVSKKGYNSIKEQHLPFELQRIKTFDELDIEKFKVEDEKRNFNALLSESKGTTKFHEETEPGGKNYTELVFKIKDKDIPIEIAYKNKKIKYEAGKVIDIPQTRKTDLEFISSRHMNVKNEIAHVRFKTRTLNGKKVLAVEEMQSDLAIASQKKRDAGAIQGYMKSDEYISDFPFKNTWYELTIKRLIRYAADNGFDAIAIPKSNIIKSRWQMTGGMADNIHVTNMENHFRVKFMNEKGITLGNIVFDKSEESLNILKKKIGENKFNEMIKHYKTYDQPNDAEFVSKLAKKVYAGKGEGTHKLYDKVFPSFMKKYGKKWNAKVYDENFRVRKEIDNAFNKPNFPVTILEITPEMKKSVLEQGQTLFEFLGFATTGAVASKAVSDNIENNIISQSTK